jgi:hypothetical protein
MLPLSLLAVLSLSAVWTPAHSQLPMPSPQPLPAPPAGPQPLQLPDIQTTTEPHPEKQPGVIYINTNCDLNDPASTVRTCENDITATKFSLRTWEDDHSGFLGGTKREDLLISLRARIEYDNEVIRKIQAR